MLVNPDGQIIISNDGATIMQEMEIEHKCARLLVELSKSQDDEIGDGTTGVVVMAGGLLEKSLHLLDKGLHPLKIAEGYEKACDLCIKCIDDIAEEIDLTDKEKLI